MQVSEKEKVLAVTWRDVTWRDVTWRDVTWRAYHGVPGIGLVAIGLAFWAAFSSSVISSSLGSFINKTNSSLYYYYIHTVKPHLIIFILSFLNGLIAKMCVFRYTLHMLAILAWET